MKKSLYLSLILTLFVSSFSLAQMAIDKSSRFVNAGIGVGGYGFFNGSGVGLNASYDQGILDDITVGVLAGYRSYGNTVSSFDIGVRGSYHFNKLINLSTDKVDLYAGLGISYYRLSYGDFYSNVPGFSNSYSTTYIPFHAGARYFFSDKLGGFAELGSSLATLRLGITFKL